MYPETMTIGVKASNDVAMHIYTKYGFEIIREEEYDASGVYYPHYVLERKI
jgi:ribosomal protein S18 acetylase RimI-like enzyme